MLKRRREARAAAAAAAANAARRADLHRAGSHRRRSLEHSAEVGERPILPSLNLVFGARDENLSDDEEDVLEALAAREQERTSRLSHQYSLAVSRRHEAMHAAARDDVSISLTPPTLLMKSTQVERSLDTAPHAGAAGSSC